MSGTTTTTIAADYAAFLNSASHYIIDDILRTASYYVFLLQSYLPQPIVTAVLSYYNTFMYLAVAL